MTQIKMNPNFERDMGAMIVTKANEALAAVGPADGRPAERLEAALSSELKARGIDLPHETLRLAAEAIAAGQPFEFRG